MARSVGIDREQVIAAAAALADEHGFEQVTLAQVAERVGVRLPSLYNHVDGLAGLRSALAVSSARALLGVTREAAIGRSGDQAVLAVARVYRAYALAHPGCYAATLRAPAPDEQELSAVAAEVVGILVAILAAYALDAEQSIHAVRGLRSIVHGFVSLEITGGFGLALDRDESFTQLLQVYVEGLRRQPANHGR